MACVLTIKHWILIVVLSLVSIGQLCAFPPDPWVNPTGQWINGQLLITSSGSGAVLLRGHRLEPMPRPKENPENQSDLESFETGSKIFAVDGVFYTTTVQKGTANLLRREGRNWLEVVRLDLGGARVSSTILPLRNGKFLVFDPPPEPAEGGKKPKKHPFAVCRVSEKGLLDVVDYGSFGELPHEANPILRKVTRGLDSAVMNDDFLVLCSPEYAIFWVFSLETGQLKRTVRPLVHEQMDACLKRGDAINMVLHLQPMMSGRILVSALNPDQLTEALKEKELFIKAARALSPQSPTPGADPGPRGIQMQAYAKFIDKRRREIRAAFPFVHWFELDPQTGSFARRNPAPVGAMEIRDADAEDFYWVVDEEDRVTMTDHDLNGILKAPTAAPALPKPSGPKRPEPKPPAPPAPSKNSKGN